MASMASFLPTSTNSVDVTWSKRVARGGGRRENRPRSLWRLPQNLSFSFDYNSSNSFRKWALSSYINASPFPLGSDPSEQESHTFPVVFSYLSSFQSPLLLESLSVEDITRDDCVYDDLMYFDEVMRLDWPSKLVSPITPGEVLQTAVPEEPRWFSFDFPPEIGREWQRKKGSSVGKWKQSVLRKRQVKVETEAWEKAAEEYREFQKEMIDKKLTPNLPYVKKLFLGWFEPLSNAIAKEQMLQKAKRQKAAYGKHIGLLPADKMAVIVMHKMMGLLMLGQEDQCVRVIQAAIHIGDAVEQEVSVLNHLSLFLLIFYISIFLGSKEALEIMLFLDYELNASGFVHSTCRKPSNS